MSQTNPYDTEFFEAQSSGSLASASVIVPMLIERFAPSSVIDVGCGIGTWASCFIESDIKHVVGLDGQYVDHDQLLIPKDAFRPTDLAEPLPDLGKFDLAISLEVAEHLPPSRSVSFVADLTGLAEVVVFSAAIPGQGGTDHVNERWQDEWAALFEEHGYVAVDCIRPRVWADPQVQWWYQQNLIVYVKRNAAELPESDQGSDMPLRIVHPSAYTGLAYHVCPENISTRKAARQLRHSASRTARRWLGFSGK
jgi:SAM-dependent methyltransferase